MWRSETVAFTVADEHRPWPCNRLSVAVDVMVAVVVEVIQARLLLQMLLVQVPATGDNVDNGRDIGAGYETRKLRMLFLLACRLRSRHLHGLGGR